MSTPHTRVVAAVVTTTELTLYRPDGTTIVIPQGDPRLRPLVDAATPQIIAQGFADIVITSGTDTPNDDSFQTYETQTGGVVRLFRVAKAKLTGWLYGSRPSAQPPVTEQTIGTVPVPPPVPDMGQAIDEIMAHATPVTHPAFHEDGLDHQAKMLNENGATPKDIPEGNAEDTIIAVVNTPDGPAVVPGMEKIRNQFERAAKLGSPTGMTNFLQRVAAITNRRQHSVKDLITFLERADLPIADDGSIIIYKLLRTTSEPGIYVDCHTRKVKQWVGAYVCMDERLVDHDRRIECSNGLHVARRGYLNSFSGDVCVLAKLAPEDVIAVPLYDANKMRVCGYHIIAELTHEQAKTVKANQPLTGTDEGKALLAAALSGNPSRTHVVRITGQAGTGVVTTALLPPPVSEPALTTEDLGNPVDPVPLPEPEPATDLIPGDPPPLAQAEALPDTREKQASPPASPLDPRDVVERMQQAYQTQQPSPRQLEIAGLVQRLSEVLYSTQLSPQQQTAVDRLREIKKTSKKSWKELTIPAELVDRLLSPPAPVQKIKASPTDEPKQKGKPPMKMVDTSSATNGPVHKISILLNQMLDSQDNLDRACALAKDIVAIKKAAKKSWTVLGVTPDQLAKIQGLLD